MAKLTCHTKDLSFDSFELSCIHVLCHILYLFCRFIWMYISGMFFYEWVAIKYNTCIIMPTISPFGLDGNNTKSLSLFDIKGKGLCSPWVHAPLDYKPDLLKSLNELPLCICHGAPIWPCSFWEHAEISALLFMVSLSIGKICKRCSARRTKTYTS